ncbi:MAG TPA: glycosyltransferase [Thermoanaerobaculia bacterium]|nr:glycosyltransferase [Thermoanaerobaculia bacterium]
MRARFARRVDGPVGATVVDDQRLDGRDAFDLLRDFAQGLRDRCFLVVCRDLDNELQLKVSVVMPVERLGGDAERAIASVLGQQAPFPFELILVSAEPLPAPFDNRVRNVVETNRNPATRRNRAVSVSSGEILAFIDDDAVAHPRWLATAVAYLDAHPAVLALGGPDPAPSDSSPAELMSETLLSTRFIGSGVAAHEGLRGIFPVRSASAIALVNLFVRRSAFTAFDESIGYIGEDTALLESLRERGRVVYHDGVIVYHRRRPFPGPYLRQRWRYRVKTGELLVRGSRAHRNNKRIHAFLVAGTVGILFAPLVIIPYAIVTFFLGARATRLPPSKWPMIPVAFAMHHATYYFGILTGIVRGIIRRGGNNHAES